MPYDHAYPDSAETTAPSEPTKPRFLKDWESDIRAVKVEACSNTEDPLGYKAIFYLKRESVRVDDTEFFTIGASFLAQRAYNLKKAGYQAPLTARAIQQIEKKIGKPLPLGDSEYLGRAV